MKSALAIARDLAAACRQGPLAFQIQATFLAREVEDIDDATGAVVDVELRAYGEGVAAYFRALPAEMAMARAVVGI